MHAFSRLPALVLLAVLSACAGTRSSDRQGGPALAASTDPAVVERGRYLAYGPAHCVACHTPDGPLTPLDGAAEPPLTGGFRFAFPGGAVHAPNLTPDPETGIGRLSDADLVRALRHNRRPDGSKAVPVMAYQDLSDEDVRALLSFLRSRPPVRHAVPEPALNLMGRIGMALVVRAAGPSRPPPALSPEGATAERGAYLVHTVAQCVGCHTRRSATGGLKGPLLAGGFRMPVEGDPEHVLVTPNLTPDAATGALAAWSEDDFVARFRRGRTYPGSHMPWESYRRMTDDDLRAVYRYLRTLPPVTNDTSPVYRRK